MGAEYNETISALVLKSFIEIWQSSFIPTLPLCHWLYKLMSAESPSFDLTFPGERVEEALSVGQQPYLV